MSAPPPDTPKAWLRSARSDLAAVRALLGEEGVLPEVVAFHAQQAAEKALKGLLVLCSVPFPRTHVLRALLDLLVENGIALPERVDGASTLTAYVSLTRYPSALEPVSEKEAATAVELAQAVVQWVEARCKSGAWCLSFQP